MNSQVPGNKKEAEELLGGTLGSLFRASREARGIPIEQAAHETRIRLSRLREIEANDLSMLSPAYARMFVRDYARYLGLSEQEIEQALPESGEFGVEGYQYIQNAPGDGPKIRKIGSPKKRLRSVAGVLALVTVLLIAGWQGWAMWRKLEAIRSSEQSAQDHLVIEAEQVIPQNSPEPPTLEEVIEEFRAVGEEPPQATASKEDQDFLGQQKDPFPFFSTEGEPRTVKTLFIDGQLATSPNASN